MKEKFNNNIEIWKNQLVILELKSLISKTKFSVESVSK
jgi:hypothetical protein